jgi:hypothetical protein
MTFSSDVDPALKQQLAIRRIPRVLRLLVTAVVLCLCAAALVEHRVLFPTPVTVYAGSAKTALSESGDLTWPARRDGFKLKLAIVESADLMKTTPEQADGLWFDAGIAPGLNWDYISKGAAVASTPLVLYVRSADLAPLRSKGLVHDIEGKPAVDAYALAEDIRKGARLTDIGFAGRGEGRLKISMARTSKSSGALLLATLWYAQYRAHNLDPEQALDRTAQVIEKLGTGFQNSSDEALHSFVESNGAITFCAGYEVRGFEQDFPAGVEMIALAPTAQAEQIYLPLTDVGREFAKSLTGPEADSQLQATLLRAGFRLDISLLDPHRSGRVAPTEAVALPLPSEIDPLIRRLIESDRR